MKSLLFLLLLSMLSLPSVVPGVDFDELTKRDGLFYKKFTNAPFTGKITGKVQGSSRSGKEHGPYERYYENGQLTEKGIHKDDKRRGPWVFFEGDGTKRMTPRKFGAFTEGEGSGLYKGGKKID